MKRVYSYDYDRSYNPSIPIVEIKIGQPWTTPLLPLTALVDSGADGSIIPLQYLRQVGARRERKSWITGITGVRTQIDIYTVALSFGPFVFDDIEVAAGKRNDEIIVGRDLLNQFIVTLDGLASVVEISW
jgi:hypothetical protein